MKIGDLVRWTLVEKSYHIACRAPGIPDISHARSRGIIIDSNGVNFFVHWEDGTMRAAPPGTIELVGPRRT